MIVTIDGPAGAGKSTVARRLAKRLGFRFLDTGAMYRAVAWAFGEMNVDFEDEAEITFSLARITLTLNGDKVFVNDQDITKLVRTPEVAQNASRAATNPAVRNALVQLQREIAQQGNYVCEGRDQGTVVFPDALCKVFLTASPEIRAERRWLEMKEADPKMPLDHVVAEQKIRDLRDETRQVGRLEKAGDAIEINVDDLTLDEVVDKIEQLVRTAVANSS